MTNTVVELGLLIANVNQTSQPLLEPTNTDVTQQQLVLFDRATTTKHILEQKFSYIYCIQLKQNMDYQSANVTLFISLTYLPELLKPDLNSKHEGLPLAVTLNAIALPSLQDAYRTF